MVSSASSRNPRSAPRRSHGRGHDHAGGAAVADCAYGDPHGGSRGDAIVGQDDDAAPPVRSGAGSAVELFATLQLGLPGLYHNVYLIHGDASCGHDARIHDAEAAAGDRAQGDLRPAGDAELAHNDHIERGGEMPGDFEPDGDSAAGQGEHHGVSAPGVAVEQSCERAACGEAVWERRMHQRKNRTAISPGQIFTFTGSGCT